MVYDTPRVTDFGSIQSHTFTNTGQVPGVGPKGKDWRDCSWDLRGGADVELVHEARRIPMRAELIEDPDRVARIYEGLIERIGVADAKATKIGLELTGDQMPTHEQIRSAIAGRRTVVRLLPR